MITEAQQHNKVQRLTNARWLITQAMEEIRQALGDTDVGDEYQEDLDILIDELSGDIDDLKAS